MYPEEVSGRVLAQLIAAAEEYTGQEIQKAVISVSTLEDCGTEQALSKSPP